ncbi:hypothetical protein GYMLUDRAFT_162350 [Collybiopsis luxurians FD-317 M1]|uniref:Unplaced genomic scaffold GYMLUscaffold_15, whole genome shotgun sequence n=1 Tax=Collybiopsis luxurians FD-317 M1 TaxID=944289 RepID=A0A0D0CV93_9AGAR|nr:hypothetical protein GYMLUDRAFT_162350 [Collybiopsis luxurians FD-317 M1]
MTSQTTTVTNPRIGVGVFVTNKVGHFIMGKRKGSHGHGTWALPGGHLEAGETFEACAAREVLEETSLEIRNVRFLTATNDIMVDEGKHYVTIFVLEPEKCETWEWVTWEELKGWVEAHQKSDGGKDPNVRSLFLPLRNIVMQRPDFDGPAIALRENVDG